MVRRKITADERAEAMKKGRKEGDWKYPGRTSSVQVDEMTDENGNVVYRVMPTAEDLSQI